MMLYSKNGITAGRIVLYVEALAPALQLVLRAAVAHEVREDGLLVHGHLLAWHDRVEDVPAPSRTGDSAYIDHGSDLDEPGKWCLPPRIV